MNFIGKRSICHPHAKAYSTISLPHIALFLLRQPSMKRDTEPGWNSRMNIQFNICSVVFSLGRKSIRRRAVDELYPSIGNDAIGWQPSAIRYFHFHKYPISSTGLFESVVYKIGNPDAGTKGFFLKSKLLSGIFSGFSGLHCLLSNDGEGYDKCPNRSTSRPAKEYVTTLPPNGCIVLGIGGVIFALWGLINKQREILFLAVGCGFVDILFMFEVYDNRKQEQKCEPSQVFAHNSAIVPPAVRQTRL